MKPEKLPSVRELSCDALHVTATYFDWTEKHGDSWECTECTACETCGAMIPNGNGELHSQIDENSECGGVVPESEGPMMSYYYELPGARSGDAMQIAHLPLCVVDFTEGNRQDMVALALTGGGMDFSWEICEGFMRMGYLPPLAFCDLPEMGRGASAVDKWIVAGCLRSCSVASKQASYLAKRVRETVKRSAERRAARKVA
jgi:hypothetical protein